MIEQLLNIENQINRFIHLLESNNYINSENSLLFENYNNLNKEFILFIKDIHKIINEIEIFFNKKRNEIVDFDIDKSIGYCHDLSEKINYIERDYKNFKVLDEIEKVTLSNNILRKVKYLRKSFNSYYRSTLGIQSNNKKVFIEIEDIKKTIEKRYENELFVFKNKINELTELNYNKLNELSKNLDNTLKEFNIKNDQHLSLNKKKLDEILNSHQNENSILTQEIAEQKIGMRNAFVEFMSEAEQIREDYILKFSKYFSEIQEGWEKIQQIKTENVYLNAYKKNNIRARSNEKKFIQTLYLSLFISLILIASFIFEKIDFQVFLTLKIMVFIFFGILVTYYLKLASHYRRLADQAEQTHLELLAFPQYVASLDPQKTNEIKEQLALKYFGKELDSTGYQKMGDAVQEQLKTSVELVKAVSVINSHNKISDNIEDKKSEDNKLKFNKAG
ncbi:hypothetical protein [Acinetobacter sp. 197]|uniref:hypothetical protein n=1 Tax=unclassified Acinetobacter TaxID=196816 RepID=UPI003A84171E